MTRLLRKINLWAAKNQRYRNTVRELSIMNDKELADIGISRCDIHEVARTGRRV
jgi:uncharacterized protein YjiS (DUF1127 family)